MSAITILSKTEEKNLYSLKELNFKEKVHFFKVPNSIMHPKIKTSKSNILISPLYDTSGNGFTPFASKLLSA